MAPHNNFFMHCPLVLMNLTGSNTPNNDFCSLLDWLLGCLFAHGINHM